jgi:hypothetical protein
VKRIQPIVAIALGVLLASCRGENGNQGSVRVQASLSAVAADRIDRLVLTISDPSDPAFPPVVALLSPAPAGWSAYVDGLPAPALYLFSLDAFDAQDTRLYAGEIWAYVDGQASTQLAIVAQQVGPGDPEASTPVISAVSVSGDPVVAGSQVTVSVTATSPDGGALAYLWRDSCGGSFLDPAAAMTTWTAVAIVPGDPCTLSIRVSQPGATATVFVPVQVQ